eukprot:3283150-Amphidinium_carterae.1
MKVHTLLPDELPTLEQILPELTSQVGGAHVLTQFAQDAVSACKNHVKCWNEQQEKHAAWQQLQAGPAETDKEADDPTAKQEETAPAIKANGCDDGASKDAAGATEKDSNGQQDRDPQNGAEKETNDDGDHDPTAKAAKPKDQEKGFSSKEKAAKEKAEKEAKQKLVKDAQQKAKDRAAEESKAKKSAEKRPSTADD